MRERGRACGVKLGCKRTRTSPSSGAAALLASSASLIGTMTSKNPLLTAMVPGEPRTAACSTRCRSKRSTAGRAPLRDAAKLREGHDGSGRAGSPRHPCSSRHFYLRRGEEREASGESCSAGELLHSPAWLRGAALALGSHGLTTPHPNWCSLEFGSEPRHVQAQGAQRDGGGSRSAIRAKPLAGPREAQCGGERSKRCLRCEPHLPRAQLAQGPRKRHGRHDPRPSKLNHRRGARDQLDGFQGERQERQMQL